MAKCWSFSVSSVIRAVHRRQFSLICVSVALSAVPMPPCLCHSLLNSQHPQTCGTEHLLFNLSSLFTYSHTLTITCTCCYDEIKGTQDPKIYSHAHSLILPRKTCNWHLIAATGPTCSDTSGCLSKCIAALTWQVGSAAHRSAPALHAAQCTVYW